MSRHLSKHAATVLLAAALLAGTADIALAEDAKLEAVRAKVSDMFEQIGPENVNYSPIDGWYTVQKGSIVAYISDDGKYLLQGDLIDLDASVNLTERSRDAARRSLVAGITDDQVITFSPVVVKHSVTIFTDTDCTYCRRLHSQIDEYMAAGIEVRYLLYPRNGPTSQTWAKAEKVWCSSDRNKALTAAKMDRDFQTSACDASNIQSSYVLGREVGLSGTPAIVLQDGTLIGGYMPPQALAQELARLSSVE